MSALSHAARNDAVWAFLLAAGAGLFALWCFWSDAAQDAEDDLDRELREMVGRP